MTSATFDTFDLHLDILTSVHALGYKTPTPIQQKSIPSILLEQDLMGLAQTGTGKTLAFVLPILQRLMTGSRGHVRALIVSPTRELAQQTHDAIGALAKTLKIRSIALYGGVGISPQIKNLRQADIVVACPGRLLDHIRQRTVDLSKVEMLVLDEADHMFDVGFLPDIRQILQQLPRKRQSLLFSATMPNEVRQLANDILKNPVTVQINNTAPLQTITQALYPVPQNLKTDLLLKLLQTHNIYSALVFTRTKHRAKRVAEQLEGAGYSATSLQGNLSQSKRQSALNNFRSGKLQILVATDIASRGIDIASISHVFNYDMPDTVEAYTHRIGRTGRAAKLGDAFTLLAREDMPKLRTLERALNIKIEQRILPDFNYKAAEPATGSIRNDAPRANKSFTDGRNKRPTSSFNQSERPTGYNKSRRPSSVQSNGERSTGGYGKSRYPSSIQGDGERSTGYSQSRRPSSAQNGHERPAGYNKPRYPSSTQSNTERPTGYAKSRHSSSAQSDGERPASRSKYLSSSTSPGRSYGERSTHRANPSNSGERSGNHYKPQGPSSRYAERPAVRTRSQNPSLTYKQGERPATRAKSKYAPTSRTVDGNRAPKAPFKRTLNSPNQKKPFSVREKERSEDQI